MSDTPPDLETPGEASRDSSGESPGGSLGGTTPDRTPPDRLCNNPASPFYDEAALSRGIGIRFKGVERTNVEEYCISEGWVRMAVGKTTDRRGMPLTMKMSGPVEAWFKDTAAS